MPDYPLYMQAAGISRRETINELKKQFPRFEKPALAMACNPEDYGLQLTPEAERRLIKAFGWYAGLSVKRQKRDAGRRKQNRLYVRLDDATASRLEDYYSRSAFASKQDLIEAALTAFLDRQGGGAV